MLCGSPEDCGHAEALPASTNLTVFNMPRLSVDIDLDFNIYCGREEMLTQREAINDLIMRYMASEGYGLKPSSKSPFSLDSWIFGYTNASRNSDNIKFPINYSDRCHALPSVESPLSIDILGYAKGFGRSFVL